MKIFFGFILGVIGTTVGIFIAHILSEHRDRRKEFNRAAEEFCEAFRSEIEYLDRKCFRDRASDPILSHILLGAIGKHQAARFKLRRYLSRTEKTEFDKAWKNYCEGGSNIHYFAEEYPTNGGRKDSTVEAKALKRIKTLLSFAKPK